MNADIEKIARESELTESQQELELRYHPLNPEGRSSYSHFNRQLPALKSNTEILLAAQSLATAKVVEKATLKRVGERLNKFEITVPAKQWQEFINFIEDLKQGK